MFRSTVHMITTAWNRTKTEVERLTVRYQGEQGIAGNKGEIDATVLRLRVERLVDTVDLQPAGLPSGALFIVRKLENLPPLPLAALSHSSPPAWRESVRDQMEALYAAAARPANGPVSPAATSILFTDAGEMLTYLTRDLLAGYAWHRWYWQPFLRNVPRPTGTALATLWSKQATFVPTVLGFLNTAEAVTAITLLSPSEVNAIT